MTQKIAPIIKLMSKLQADHIITPMMRLQSKGSFKFSDWPKWECDSPKHELWVYFYLFFNESNEIVMGPVKWFLDCLFHDLSFNFKWMLLLLGYKLPPHRINMHAQPQPVNICEFYSFLSFFFFLITYVFESFTGFCVSGIKEL